MKWKVENSKFYAEIMEAAVKYFGMDAETTTEAELHQKFETAESVDTMRASLKTEVEAAVKTETEKITARVTELEATVKQLQTDLAASKTALEAANNQVAELQKADATKDAELNNAKAQNKSLAADLAKIKAGGKSTEGGDGDGNLPIPEGAANGVGTEIKATEFAQRLGIKKA